MSDPYDDDESFFDLEAFIVVVGGVFSIITSRVAQTLL